MLIPPLAIYHQKERGMDYRKKRKEEQKLYSSKKERKIENKVAMLSKRS
jgi:hypothetical protein